MAPSPLRVTVDERPAAQDALPLPVFHLDAEGHRDVAWRARDRSARDRSARDGSGRA
jgi:hypothetical protein